MFIPNRSPGHAGAAFRSGGGPHLGIAGFEDGGESGRPLRKLCQDQSLKQSGLAGAEGKLQS